MERKDGLVLVDYSTVKRGQLIENLDATGLKIAAIIRIEI